MELLYLNILNIFTVNVVDVDKILPINSKTYKNFFTKKNLNYKLSFDTIINTDKTINILIKNGNKKEVLDYNKLGKNYLKLIVHDNILEIYDSINNSYYSFDYKNKTEILSSILFYLKFDITINQQSGRILLPCGYKNRVILNLGMTFNYLISKNTDNTLKIVFKDKTFNIKCKKVKNTPSYFLSYIETILKLRTEYFLDSWFYSKYINLLKGVFRSGYNKKRLELITKRVVNHALDRKSSNRNYNRNLFFIKNNELYNSYLIDLYNFKIECKNFKSYLLSDHKGIYKKLCDKVTEKSEDYFTSKISYSTWLESFEDGDYFGLLANGNYKRNCLSANEPMIFVKNLNQCILSNDDFIESHKFYFDKYKTFDNGKNCSNLISYDGIGKGNIFLPIYICEEHFNIVKMNIASITGINLHNNPIKFVKKNILIYVSYISEFIATTFSNKLYNNSTWQPLLINYLLFVKEIVSNYYTNQDLINLYEEHLNKVKFNLNFTIGISVLIGLFDNYELDLDRLVLKLVEEMIRIKCSKYYSDIKKDYTNFVSINFTKFTNYLNKLSLNNEEICDDLINKEMFMLFNNVINKSNDVLFIKKIWSIYHFHRNLVKDLPDFFEDIKNNFGILSIDNIEKIKSVISNNQFPENNGTIKGILNPLFDGHILYNKQLVINLDDTCKLIDDKLFTDNCLYAMFLQGFLQRNYNSRKLALKNKNLYFNPMTNTKDCIFNCLKIFIKIWSKSSFREIYNQLVDSFKKTSNSYNILGIYYIVEHENKLEEFIVDIIKDGNVKMIKFKLDLLNGKNVKEDMKWLLPIDSKTKKRKTFELKLLSWNIPKRNNNK